MIKTILLIGTVQCCWATGIHLGDHHGGGLTLGEISLDHHGLVLPAISLGHADGSFGGHGLLTGHHGSWDWASDITIGQPKGDGHFIPIVKHIGIPVPKKVEIPVPHPVVEKIPQPYPVAVIVPKPVPYEVIKPVFKKVEKKVPFPVEKIIPVKIEKPVPFKVEKHVPYFVKKPVPIKIPVHKTIVHGKHD